MKAVLAVEGTDTPQVSWQELSLVGGVLVVGAVLLIFVFRKIIKS